MSQPAENDRFSLISGSPRMRILHLTWLAFFITFFIWFNHAPLMAAIRATLDLSDEEVKTLLILNVALTIPARIVIGMLVDQFGPRKIYAAILFIAGITCFAMARADSFSELASWRFLTGFVGAGFVVGIRMIGEWFPPKSVGLALGIYGGWGNFGSAAAAMSLPGLAIWLGAEHGWRHAMDLSGAVAILYAFIYLWLAKDTPDGNVYFRPNKAGPLELSSRRDVILYAVMALPLGIALALLVWRLGPDNLAFFSRLQEISLYLFLGLLCVWQILQIWRTNKHIFEESKTAKAAWPFRQVAVLALAYFVTFGSELAVVSMLPLYFHDNFGLTMAMAGLLASGFAFMNLFARPMGGLLSDRYGRRKTLLWLLTGLAIGYAGMTGIDHSWSPFIAILLIMACSFFVQSGEGAVFAVVPLIHRPVTGQIAGIVGAWGNVGAVIYLTVLSFTGPGLFFGIICLSAWLAIFIALLWLDEPAASQG